MRSTFALLPAALLIVALTGCTKDSTPDSSSTQPTNQDRATTGGQPVPSPASPAPHANEYREGTASGADRTGTAPTKNDPSTKTSVSNNVDARARDNVDPVPASDNSGTNTRDRDGAHLTPLDQGSSESDIEITQAIRKAVVDEDELSINAQNVKIITKDGVVTLRGPVATPVERAAIETLAQRTAGVLRVDNQLEITNP